MKRIFLIIFIFFLLTNVSANMEIELIKPADFGAGKINTFYYDISCFVPEIYLQEGDLVNYNFFICANDTCNNILNDTFVFKIPCNISGSFDYFIPDTINGQIVESVDIVFMAKQLEDISFPIKKTFTFGGAFISDSSITIPTLPIIAEEDYSFYMIAIGIFLLTLSAILIMIKNGFAILPFLIGVILIIFAIFG